MGVISKKLENPRGPPISVFKKIDQVVQPIFLKKGKKVDFLEKRRNEIIEIQKIENMEI